MINPTYNPELFDEAVSFVGNVLADGHSMSPEATDAWIADKLTTIQKRGTYMVAFAAAATAALGILLDIPEGAAMNAAISASDGTEGSAALVSMQILAATISSDADMAFALAGVAGSRDDWREALDNLMTAAATFTGHLHEARSASTKANGR